MDCKIYLVGGSVRDKLMGKRVKDHDFAVEAPSYEAMKEFLKPRLIKVWQERPQFFSLRAQAAISTKLLPVNYCQEFGPCDFTLCRAESDYTDGRHPDTVKPATILTDLARRDFTINAMAIGEDDVVLDPHGGIADLDARLIRTVGNPEDRFREDSLRIMRALRFSVTLGMLIDDDTSDAMEALAWTLDDLPVERVQYEMLRMFQYDWRSSAYLLTEFPNVAFHLSKFKKLWLKPTLEDK